MSAVHTSKSVFQKSVTASLMVLSLCSGCALPRVVPDMKFSDTNEVRLEDGHGPLSVQKSREILSRLKEGQDKNLLERHLAVEEAIAGSPLIVGNKLTLLQDGPTTYQAMFAALRNARDHINFETYIFEADEVGQRFADLLIEKQKSGVQVNLIYDSVGAMNTPKEFFQRLTDSGIKVLEFNPINPLALKKGWQVNQRDHRKLLIIDGKIAFLGGINISSVYSGGSFKQHTKVRPNGPPWRDTHLQLEGPVVGELQKLFLNTWARQKADPLAPRTYFPPLTNKGSEIVRAIGSAPEAPYNLIYATFISAINSAESAVHITNAYFVPDQQLRTALINAAQRGVDVKLILPSTTDSWPVLHAGQAYYDELLAGGVKIYERRGALLHVKSAVLDGVWSTVGSTNLDWRSLLHNEEINAVILGADFAAQVEAVFQADLATSTQITLEAWRQRSLDRRIKELLGKMWAYWL
ncbi:MAG: cardiolipin synthase [Burkholderiaceae bacterium]|nr:MAG: cardiolipin synthase [Burkholderiaceae bacterium]